MDLKLNGTKVLVTAASKGLGAGTAHRFSAEGAAVVINSRDLGTLQETAAAINQATGNPIFTIASDLSTDGAAERVVTNAAEMLGGLDILVINAGGPPAGSFEDFDMATWERATRLTFFSAVRLVRASLPYLRQSNRAAVLAIQSTSVKQPIDNLTLSNVIRPAVIGLMKSLSLELGPEGIRCNSILPGITETGRVDDLMNARAEKNDSSPADEREKAASGVPLRRIGSVEEFANAAVFLCSPAAGFINGVALPVDGGTIRATL